MEYLLRPTEFFLQQILELTPEGKRYVEEKLKLVKINPFRYKRIVGYDLFLFRIRFEDQRREKRVIYLVDKPYVNILCLLERDGEYKNLRKYLKKLGYL